MLLSSCIFACKPTWFTMSRFLKISSKTSFGVHSLEISKGSFTLLSEFPFVYKQKSKQWRSDLVGQIICWQFPLLPSMFACEETAEERHNKKIKRIEKVFLILAFLFSSSSLLLLLMLSLLLLLLRSQTKKRKEWKEVRKEDEPAKDSGTQKSLQRSNA